MKETMNTILLITLSKDTNCPYNQRIKINNILKKGKISFLIILMQTKIMLETIRLMPIFQLMKQKLGK